MLCCFKRGRVFVGWVKSSTVSVLPACLLASMAAARCVCGPICLISGNPVYSEKSETKHTGQNKNIRSDPGWIFQRREHWLCLCCQYFDLASFSLSLKTYHTHLMCILVNTIQSLCLKFTVVYWPKSATWLFGHTLEEC